MSRTDQGNSELILNLDGSVYHLKIKPEHIAPTVIVVGDQGRVETVSEFFDYVEVKKANREFCTHTGMYNNKRITVMSTGIGTDNIDIVLNELDAAVNIDLKTGEVKDELTSLNIVRLGTSGSLRREVETGSFLVSSSAVGMDGLMRFYDVSGSDHGGTPPGNSAREEKAADEFVRQMELSDRLPYPYVRFASKQLFDTIKGQNPAGITITAPGFYAPQGRSLRLPTWDKHFHDRLKAFEYEGERITNFEMETSALFGLGQALGHQTASVCCIIANRASQTFLENYQPAVKRMIGEMLDKLTAESE